MQAEPHPGDVVGSVSRPLSPGNGFNNEAQKELHVPALLEMLDIAYTGGNPQCLAYCYDKSLVRGVASEMDIPMPRAFVVPPEEVAFIALPMGFPVIVKPNLGDSSVGITTDSVCYDVAQLETAIARVRQVSGFARVLPKRPLIALAERQPMAAN